MKPHIELPDDIERLKTLVNRALNLIQKDWGYGRQRAYDWINDDNGDWEQEDDPTPMDWDSPYIGTQTFVGGPFKYDTTLTPEIWAKIKEFETKIEEEGVEEPAAFFIMATDQTLRDLGVDPSKAKSVQ